MKHKLSLRQMQSKFVYMRALLILHAYHLGYELTPGRQGRISDAANKADGGHKRSLHKLALADDWNLFKNGKYLRSTKAHRLLGEYWESIGGTWGGRWGDGNHYSLEYKGMT